MHNERYSILYSSATGNTRLLADTIRAALPQELCDAFGAAGETAAESELLYVGFWTDKGNADADTLALIAAAGIGRRLLEYGAEHYGIREVTVNEQNPQAVGFYEHMGFVTYKRTDRDEQGGPYPLLYMRRA